MSLKRFLIALVATLFVVCGSATVQAGKYDELEENIKIAKVRFDEAKEQLRSMAGVLFEVFVGAPDIYVRHSAELEIKARYPREYGNYVESAIELDDAEYALYVAKMNDQIK